MKKCPLCAKTYDDSLKFCQSDGTLLVDGAAPSGDPFSTAEPEADPFKTMVAAPNPTGAISPPRPGESGEARMPSGDLPSSEGPGSMPPSPFSKPSSPIPAAPKSPTPPPAAVEEKPVVSFGSETAGAEEPPTVMSPAINVPNIRFGDSQEPPRQVEPAWTPPPAPIAAWDDKGVGASTPFQPPTEQGADKTLAIVSLVSGLVAWLPCCWGPGAIVAIITGFMAKRNVDSNPAVYGGRGMAIAGMVLGVLNLVLVALYFIVYIALMFFGAMVN